MFIYYFLLCYKTCYYLVVSCSCRLAKQIIIKARSRKKYSAKAGFIFWKLLLHDMYPLRDERFNFFSQQFGRVAGERVMLFWKGTQPKLPIIDYLTRQYSCRTQRVLCFTSVRHTVASARRRFHKNLLQIGDRYVDAQTRHENRSVAPRRRRVSAFADYARVSKKNREETREETESAGYSFRRLGNRPTSSPTR